MTIGGRNGVQSSGMSRFYVVVNLGVNKGFPLEIKSTNAGLFSPLINELVKRVGGTIPFGPGKLAQTTRTLRARQVTSGSGLKGKIHWNSWG